MYVNINSLTLSLKQYDAVTGQYSYAEPLFSNYVQLFKSLPVLKYAIFNSLIYFVISLAIGVPTGLIFAYFIFRKGAGHKFFHIILFLPSIICSMITVVMYRYFVELAVPTFLNKIFGTNIELLFSKNNLVCVFIYNLFMGFGVPVLTYLGAMNGISKDVFEAAEIDGAGPFRVFFSVVLPQIFSTLSVFIVTAFTGIFIAQLNLFTFFANSLQPYDWSVGYYLYKEVLFGGEGQYPFLATMGVVITLIIAPLTFLLRRFFARIDPMGDRPR
ncbi:MAG: carbohydrate ABC transporter permease [Bacilli bacterium]